VRFEIGPLRLGLAGHYGQGLGFYYAQENSQVAYYNAPDVHDANDGKLRTFQGFYGQAMLDFGRVAIGAGAGASQALRFSFEQTQANPDGSTNGVVHPPKQNLGFNAEVWIHLYDNVVLDFDFFRAQYSWWGAHFTQTVNVVNSGLTMMF